MSGKPDWAPSIFDLISTFYNTYSRHKDSYSEEVINTAGEKLIADLHAAYDDLSDTERSVNLIPDKWGYLHSSMAICQSDSEDDKYENYYFNYKWPCYRNVGDIDIERATCISSAGREFDSVEKSTGDGGFIIKRDIIVELGDVEAQPCILEKGMKYDRFGTSAGNYISPFVNGRPQSYESRSLPYYVPERDFTDNPAYHLYEAQETYRPTISNELCYGSIAPAFDQPGRGKQIRIDPSIKPDTNPNNTDLDSRHLHLEHFITPSKGVESRRQVLYEIHNPK